MTARSEREKRGLLARARRINPTSDYPSGASTGDHVPVPARDTADGTRREACTALSELFLRMDGWLRVVPAGDGKTLYFKWKFTRGEWSGYYVMFVSLVWEWDKGIAGLRDKCDEVDQDARRPVKDKWYYEDTATALENR